MDEFVDLLARFTRAVEARDGAAFGALFTDDASYEDYVYGEFVGPKAIGDMLVDLWWKEGRDYKWTMFNPVRLGDLGYAESFFSFNGASKHSVGKHAVSHCVSQFRFRGGKFCQYREWSDTLAGFTQMGVPGDLMVKIGARKARQLLARPDVAPHL